MCFRLRTPAAFVIGLAVAAGQAGCTDAMWRSAACTTFEFDRLAGVTTDVAGRRSVVVQYHLTESTPTRAYLLVRLDASGRPVPPFAVSAGPVTTGPVDLWGRVSDAQRAALLAAVGGERVSPYVAAVGSPDASRACFDGRGLWAAAYQFDRSGRLIAVPLARPTVKEPRWDAAAYVLTDATVVVVPVDLRRSAASLAAARRWAVILTPLTVAADVPLTAAAIILIFTGFTAR